MKYDVIVVGGGPAGIITAATAKKYYPEKRILLVKSVGKGVIPCAIPYMFATLKNPEDNAMGDAPLEKNRIELKVDEVVSIDRDKKSIRTKSGKAFGYDKLVIATGSNPVMPPIKGNEKKGVYCIQKDMGYLKKLKEVVSKARNIVIVGGGFIGVEFADELSRIKGKKVSIVELMPEILANSFDAEFSALASQKLAGKGVEIITGSKVESFNGGKKVESVSISGGKKIPADLVILGIGAAPNSGLAEKAGLDTGKHKGIAVDENMRTSDDNVFAVGDCAAKKDFLTRKSANVMLASTATAEARIAGSNLFKLKVVKENKGTIAIYSTKVSDLALGSAGLTEKAAVKEGFDITVGSSECIDKHPAALPGAGKIKVKLVFSKQSGILLGGQAAGGESAGEIINIIGVALQKNISLTELETMQVATHPKLTAAPTVYPIIAAAQDALMQYESCK